MRGMLRVSGVMGLTLLGLLIFTRYMDQPAAGGRKAMTRSTGEVLGYPVVSMAQFGARGVIAISQVDARGIIAIGQLGFGVLAVVQGGVGLVAGVGQAMVGLLAIAQLGVGFLFFLGQMGGGFRAAGQGVIIRKPWAYFEAMFQELDDVLAGRSPDRPS